jgi:uncharacterized membrane protein YgcG
MLIFAGSVSSDSTATSSQAVHVKVEVSSNDEGMDWSDNLHGIKELYEEGRQLELKAVAAAGTGNTQQGGEATVPPPALETQPDGAQVGGAAGSSGGVPPESAGGTPLEEEEEDSAFRRAKEFLNRQKEDNIAKIKAGLGDKYLAYDAIVAARRRNLATPHLLGGETAAIPDTGSFLSNGDGRNLLAHMEVNLGQRRVTSYSFNPNTFMCKCQGEHSSRIIAGGRGGPKTQREAIILADQSYPPVLLSSTDKLCINIVRVEHEMLYELADVLVDALRGRYLEAGSVVMLFSATNLAYAGMVGYCSDMMGAIERLKRGIGEHVMYIPAPHLFSSGFDDGDTIRAAVEVGAWSIHVFVRDQAHLKRSFLEANGIITDSGHGGVHPDHQERHRLPTADGTYTTWVSGGLTELPAKVAPANLKAEEVLVNKLIGELRAGLAINLEPSPSMERRVGPCSAAAAGGGILVVGSNNAKRLHAAMEEAGEEAGEEADLIYEANFRVTRASVEDLTEKVKNKINAKRPDVVVVQILDSSLYSSLSKEGERSAMVKVGNRYHAEGDLALADPQTLLKLLKLCRQLFEVVGDTNMVMGGPLPRYVTAGCCSLASHMPNRSGPDFTNNMLSELYVLNKCVKDFLYNEDYRRARAMDPWVGLRDIAVTALWGNDPVHILPEHFRPLVEGVRISIGKIPTNGNVKKRMRAGDAVDQERKRGKSGDRRGGHGGGGGARGGPGTFGGGRRGSYGGSAWWSNRQ